jgi:hypothetical protein
MCALAYPNPGYGQSDTTAVHPTYGLVCCVPYPNLTYDMVSQTEQKSTNAWPNDQLR